MRQLLTYMMTVVLLIATVEAASPASSESQPKIANVKATSIETGPTAPRLPYKPNLKPAKAYEIGKASWYGRQFHGRTTASGEPFDMFTLTAAHRHLPLGTWVKVTNVRNSRSVIVRINDRGPVPESRIIDLSFEAATLLDLRARGVEKVRLDLLKPEAVAYALNLNQLN
jgi:rare lipoprotein A